MAYIMVTKEKGDYFRANILSMGMLCCAMHDCGVEGGPMVERELEPCGGRRTLEGNLYSCFGSNDGWLVTPEESQYIADSLKDTHYGPDGYTSKEFVEFVKGFADYCKKAAEQGGFYVW